MTVSVCLSVREHISGTTRPIFAKFVHCTLPVSAARTDFLWQRCDTLCTSGFMDDVIFVHNGHHEEVRV